MLTCSSTLAPSFFSSSISNFISSTSYRISAVSWVCFNQCIADQLKGATKVTCCFAFIFFVDSSAFFLLFFTSSSAVLSSFSRWDFASWNQVKCGFQHELTITSLRYSLSWQIYIFNSDDKTSLSWNTPHRRSNPVSLETYPFYSLVKVRSFTLIRSLTLSETDW